MNGLKSDERVESGSFAAALQSGLRPQGTGGDGGTLSGVAMVCGRKTRKRGAFNVHNSALPGAGKFASTASITNTQSSEAGGVKSRLPVFAQAPISSVEPSTGLNHPHVEGQFGA